MLLEVDLIYPLSGPLVCVGNQIGAVQTTKAGVTFKLYNSNDLAESGSIELVGRLVAGPFPVTDGCVLQTNAELLAISPTGQKRWSIDFPYTQLVAAPTQVGNNLLMVTKAGPVLLLDAATGSTVGLADAGQALTSAPLVLPNGLLIGSDEGAVLALPMPSSAEVQ